MPPVNAPQSYFAPAAHNVLLSWLEQEHTVIAVRQAVVRETYEKARYNNLQNLRKKEERLSWRLGHAHHPRGAWEMPAASTDVGGV